MSKSNKYLDGIELIFILKQILFNNQHSDKTAFIHPSLISIEFLLIIRGNSTAKLGSV